MIRFMKNRIRLAHLLSVILLLSLFVPLFSTSVVPEAEAAMVTNVNSEVPYYADAYSGYNRTRSSSDLHPKGGIIYVGSGLSYDLNQVEWSEFTTAYNKSGATADQKKTALAGIRMRFYTLTEAFWFIHSGGGNASKYQSLFQSADWVIIVTDKQVFNYNSNYSATPNNTTASVSSARLKAGYNYLYYGYDITLTDDGAVVETGDRRVCTFNIDGSYSFSLPSLTTKAESYDDTGKWREFKTNEAWVTYAHSGTWYITSYYHSSTDYTSTGSIAFEPGSPTYFSTGGPTHFSKLKFTSKHNVVFYGDYSLTIGTGVSTPAYTSTNKYLFSIYAGAADQPDNYDEASTVTSSTIVISSGNWRTVMAGGDRGRINGSSTLRITGSAQVYSNVTLGFNKAVSGDVNFYLDGNAKVAFLYASPRIHGSTGGSTNIHLIGGLLYNWLDVGMNSAAVTMSNNVNAYVYEGTKIFNMSPKWQQANLNGGDTSKIQRNLYLVGDQSFVTSDEYSCLLNGFDNVYIQNNSTVNYGGVFKTTANVNVASGSKLYLSDYSSDSNLVEKIGDLTKTGSIYYTLLMYVNGNYTLPTYNFSIIPLGAGTSYPEPFVVVIVQDGYSKETTWNTLAQAYTAAAGAKVDCTFIVWGNTTQDTSLKGSSYNNISNSVTITSDNNAVLTIPAASGFGNITALEDIEIVIKTPADTPTASLYSGRNLIIKEGTKISTSTGVGWQINSGWADAACNYPIKIELYTSNPQGLSLGNPTYATGANISAVIAGDAHVGKVFFGRSPASNGDYTTTLTVNSTNAKVNSIYATPRSDDGNDVTLNGDVVINLYNGSFVEQTYDGTELASGVKCIDTNGYLNGDVTINITDEFVYTDKTIFFKSTQNPDTLINGTVTMNLAGWEGDEEFTQTDWLTYVDKLGAVTTPAGYKTNVICRQVLPTRLISDASDTSTYAVNIDAAAENQMYFHNDAYDYLKLTGSTSPATSGGTLVFGHNLVTTSAKRATALGDANKGWIEYHQCSICSNYYTSVANANSGTSCTLDSCYRYWYEVNVNTLTDDGGAGGTISATKFADDERYFSGSVTATPNTYYSFGSWSNNGLGTVNGAGYTLNIANVKNVIGKTGGTTTLTANFTRNRADLTVTKESVIHDTTQVFVYKVETPDSAALPGLTMYVTVKGNGSTVIKDLPAGEYTVTQQNDWSWRYNNRLNEVRTFTLESDHTAEFDLSKILVTINTSWLDVNSAIMKVRG